VYRFLEEAFWRDEFLVAHEQVEHLVHPMEDEERPILETELAEFLVRDVLKNEQEFASARIYSPAQKYRIGERIVFIHEKGAKYAEVLQVTSAGAPDNELGNYERVYVQFKREVGWKSYVANCPGFPLTPSVRVQSRTGFPSRDLTGERAVGGCSRSGSYAAATSTFILRPASVTNS